LGVKMMVEKPNKTSIGTLILVPNSNMRRGKLRLYWSCL
jgi:hypothetical protein